MTPRRRGLGRVGLLLLGLVAGFALAAMLAYWFVDRSRHRVIEEEVRVALGLPEEAFSLERVEEDGSLRIRLRDVAFLDRAGDTIVSAPSATGRLVSRTLSVGPEVVIDQVVLDRPFLRLLQRADGEWNFFDIFRAEAAGQPLQAPDEAGERPIAFRGLRVVDGTARIATPFTPPGAPMPGRFASAELPERIQTPAGPYTVRRVTDLQATLPLVRVEPGGGWRAEVASLSADVRNPDTRIVNLAGWIQQDADETIRFDLDDFRTPRSRLAGSGRVRFADEAPVFDVELRAAPLAFADLQGMGLPVPEEGTAAFVLDAESRPGGRTLWGFSGVDVRVLDSRAFGRLAVLTGGDEPVFSDTRLTLDPLVLADVETLGFLEEPLPLLGTVRGTVASPDALELGEGGPLRLDLAASLVPRDAPGAEPSIVTARGDVRWTPNAADAVRFDALAVGAEPLRLEHLAGFFEAPPAWLRGLATGSATLSGSPSDLRITGGELAYAVGGAPETVLRGLSGRFVPGEPVRWELEARAEPLALATLTELFPALPFRAATLSGPIAVSGVGDDVRFDVDLGGASGALAARGTLTLGEPLRFDVAGRVEAFRAQGLLAAEVPLEGALTGTFSARGTADDFGFQVDMRQPPNGSFALGGRLRSVGGTYAYDVSGRVDEFRLGLLVGQPGLLPGRVSGPISIQGGGGAPVAFDVALTGEQGTFDVRGSFLPGTVPSYTVAGRVRGLDLSGIPGLAAFPATRLNATVDIDARGTTPATLDGRIAFDALPGSTVAGVPLEAGRGRLIAADGVLRVETLELAMRGARLTASGRLGLTEPSAGVVRFDLDAPNLAVLAAVLPPPGRFEPAISGSLAASGWVGGSLEAPQVAVNARGTGLRYETYAAGLLTLEARLARGGERWTGNVALEGREVAVGAQTLRTVALEANLTPESATFGLDVRRDADTDLRASGTLELDGLAVNGVLLRELDLRLRDAHWTLAVPQARVARVDGGLLVENLHLERSGAGSGFVAVDGRLPREGAADLAVRAQGLDLAELGGLFPQLPAMAGTLVVDAEIAGTVEEPGLRLDGSIDGFTFGGVALDRVTLSGDYTGRTMRLTAEATLGGRSILEADARVPMVLTLGGLVPGFELLRTQELAATIRADSLPLQLVAASLPTMMENGDGAAAALIQVGGTLDRPELTGSAGVRGAVTVVPLGVRWEDIDAALALAGQTVTVERATARTADDGTARISGRLLFDQPQAPAVDLLIEMDGFLAIDRPRVARLHADAGMRIGGRLPAAELGGWVQLEDGTISIPELGADTEADILDVEVGSLGADTVAAEVATGGLFGGLLPRDVEVRIGDNVWLESREARIQIEGSVQVYEAAGSPRIYGDLQTVRGTYALRLGPLEREFEIVQGTVQFAGTPDINPRLDITARHRVRGREAGSGDIAVLVQLGGTMQNPTLALSSDTRPPLPESELLTLLIFGRRSYELANIPQEFTQGIILEQLVGGVVTREIEEAFVRLGIFDYVRLRASPTGTGLAGGLGGVGTDLFAYATLEAGLQVWEDAFLVLEIVNLFSDPRPGVALEWQATETWNIRAARSPVRRDPLLLNLQQRAYQITVEARRRWEYGRPPEQPDPLADDAPPADGPRPAEPSTPEGTPPPEPREPVP